MITVNEIEELDPNFVNLVTPEFRDHWIEAASAGQQMLKRAERMWLISEGETPLMLAGIEHLTFAHRPELWVTTFVGFKAIHTRTLRFLFDTILSDLYGNRMEVTIRSGAVHHEKFAKFFGFRFYEKGELFDTYRMN